MLLASLDGVEHSDSSVMEVGFSIKLGVGKEVDQSSLLYEFVFTIDTVVLKLLFGVSKMLSLYHLNLIGPLVGELVIFVSGVDVVEYGELGSWEEGEVTDLNESNVVSYEVLVMPDHSSEPVVVLPATESRDHVDRCDVCGKENKSST